MLEGKSVKKFTHIDPDGNAIMVDVSEKDSTQRQAIAKGAVFMELETLNLILSSQIKKGDVFSTAQLAGIMGAKKTSNIIPLCHPLNLSSVKVRLSCDKEKSAVNIEATCKVSGKTGVEMEALTAVAVAALTIYDMCKAVDRGMTIADIHLEYKEGGNSGTYSVSKDD